jgi:methyl-accepting chemotaxis protein WspA
VDVHKSSDRQIYKLDNNPHHLVFTLFSFKDRNGMNILFKNLSLQARIIGAFALMAFLILLVTVLGLRGSSRLSDHIETIAQRSFPSTVALWKINEGQTQVQSSERSLLNTFIDNARRQKELERIQSAWNQINDGFASYQEITRTPKEEEIYNTFLPLWKTWEATHKEFLDLNAKYQEFDLTNPRQIQIRLLEQGKNNTPEMVKAKAAVEALAAMNEQTFTRKAPAFHKAADALTVLRAETERVAKIADMAAHNDVDSVNFGSIASLLIGPPLALIFGFYFSFSIAKPLGAKIGRVIQLAEQISAGDLTANVQVSDRERDEVGKLLIAFRTMIRDLGNLVRQVQQSGLHVSASTSKIAASSRQLEATVNEQAASTNQVVATAKEIASTSQSLARTMEEVSDLSQLTAQSASSSQQDLHHMESTMQQLANYTGSISSKLGVISEKAHNINSVVTTITKVADQTNLLSLNAAIEAEQAGEYGRGFAVVSREIRRLADQTAVATLDIEHMVKEMQSSVSSGVMEMDKFTKEVERSVQDIRTVSLQISKTIEQVQSLTPRFSAVNQGMEAQSEGAQQISYAMAQLSEASNQTASTIREINSIVSGLDEAAQLLREEISRFHVTNL